jgi:hypothetical protein
MFRPLGKIFPQSEATNQKTRRIYSTERLIGV